MSNGLKKFGASDSILTGCMHSKPQIVESFTPMHCRNDRKDVWNLVKKNPFVFPVNEIRNYYGTYTLH